MNVRTNNVNQKTIEQIIKRDIQYITAPDRRDMRTSSEPVLLVLIHQRILPHFNERSGTLSIKIVTALQRIGAHQDTSANKTSFRSRIPGWM